MKVPFILFILTELTLSFGDPTYNSKPNPYWTCSGCRNDVHRDNIFSAIRVSLQSVESNPPVYFHLSYDWLSAVLDADSDIVVNFMTENELSQVSVLPEKQQLKSIQFLVVESDNHAFQDDAASSYSGYKNEFAELPLFPGVDEVLTRNPCWLPLQEPFLHNDQYKYYKGSSSNNNIVNNSSSNGNNNRHLLTSLRLRHASHWSHLTKFLILVKLPPQYGPTCKLYSAFLRHQFPPSSQCKFTDKDMYITDLGNIGITHAIVGVVYNMVDNLINSPHRIFSSPIAEPYNARPVNDASAEATNSNSNGGKGKVNEYSGWSWADPSTCPPQTFLHNPWACNFMPFTNCSNRYKSAELPKQPGHVWESPKTYLTNLGITTESRAAAGDSPSFEDDRWTEARLTSLVLRPNQWLRYLIRRSIHSIRQIRSNSFVGTNTGAASNEATSIHQHDYLQQQLLFQQQHPAPRGKSCITMHVRHNDAVLDSRGDTADARSFQHHLVAAKHLSMGLGSRDVFLATDNATIVSDIVAGKYPQYDWYIQRRPMSRKSQMFLMFTEPYMYNEARPADGMDEFPIPSEDQIRRRTSSQNVTAGNPRQTSQRTQEKHRERRKLQQVHIRTPEEELEHKKLEEQHKHEQEIQQQQHQQQLLQLQRDDSVMGGVQGDLSHILADIFYSTRCIGMVGAFDSGLTALIYRMMCSVANGGRGRCPPNIDLRDFKATQ